MSSELTKYLIQLVYFTIINFLFYYCNFYITDRVIEADYITDADIFYNSIFITVISLSSFFWAGLLTDFSFWLYDKLEGNKTNYLEK